MRCAANGGASIAMPCKARPRLSQIHSARHHTLLVP
jgi:hypothetical protein